MFKLEESIKKKCKELPDFWNDTFENVINEQIESNKAILFYDGSFELESIFNEFNKNFNIIDFWMVNVNLTPELNKYCNLFVPPFVNFYEGKGQLLSEQYPIAN